jgi:hypothetical protein
LSAKPATTSRATPGPDDAARARLPSTLVRMGDQSGAISGPLARGRPIAFDELLLKLYRSVSAGSPWTEFLD